MKKIIICNIPMKERVDKVIYSSNDNSIPVAQRKVHYPICAFLEKTMTPEDEIKVVAIVKKDNYGHYKNNLELFRSDMEEANSSIGAAIEYRAIDSEFSENRSVHEQLMGSIIDEIPQGAHLLVDTTFGPKDLPIVIFAALNFAEKFLDCSVENILYGQAGFVNGQPVDTKICDMVPLYCLSSVTNTIHCSEPDKARLMLKTLLSL